MTTAKELIEARLSESEEDYRVLYRKLFSGLKRTRWSLLTFDAEKNEGVLTYTDDSGKYQIGVSIYMDYRDTYLKFYTTKSLSGHKDLYGKPFEVPGWTRAPHNLTMSSRISIDKFISLAKEGYQLYNKKSQPYVGQVRKGQRRKHVTY